MKKYLFGALALPLLFACSSDDLIEKRVVSNDQFAGIQKVDATFSMDEDEGQRTRMDKGSWSPEEGDLWGFAWLGDGTVIDPTATGIAYQNHNLIQTGTQFVPQTSIYVGSYFIYRPYDFTTVNPQAINFSLEEQTIDDGYESEKKPWKDLAQTAINIGDKWTVVDATGWDDLDGKTWDKAGIKQNYKLYAAMFSNQTGLDLTYVNNNVDFSGKTITGATDIIGYKYPEGSTIGAADIYGGSVELDGADNAFTYAPTAEPNVAAHNGNFWEHKKDLMGAGGLTGFTWPGAAPIILNAPDETGISTDKTDNKGWFWFNSLPITNGGGTSATDVTTILNTSFGTLTMTKTLAECAWAFEDPVGTPIGQKEPVKWKAEWIQLAAADADPIPATGTPRKWDPALHSTFINQYGNHKGKYALTADFKDCDMSVMHIKDDKHLQKALKFYIATGKTNDYTLNLDKDGDDEFKISKISIALLQTINNNTSSGTVLVQACGTAGHTPDRIVVTQEGQDKIDALKNKKEVPALDKVFAAPTKVYLAKNTDWTWGGGADGETALPIDGNVSRIYNEGTIKVTATNIQLSQPGVAITNAVTGTINITETTTVKTALSNVGTINVGAEDNTTAELRAYNVAITNNATALNACGTINNYGVIGSSQGTTGQVFNYGLIDMKNKDAITLLKSNEKGTKPFNTPFDASANKMGTVLLPENTPTALVSVANSAENGFIKYKWSAATYTHDTHNVKYNTIVVSNDIEFTGAAATEIQYIEFDGTKTMVVNPSSDDKLTELKGIIVNAKKSFIIEKNNVLNCSVGAYLGKGATIYKGGAINYPAGAQNTNYFGTWQEDQIVKW